MKNWSPHLDPYYLKRDWGELGNGLLQVKNTDLVLFFLFLTLSERHSTASSPLSPSSDSASSDVSHRQGSPVLTPYSDTTSSSSETDQVPNAIEKPARKRRKRATFTQREKMQLEMAFRHQQYLIGDDEKVLAQRLGLTAKNVRVSENFSLWFWKELETMFLAQRAKWLFLEFLSALGKHSLSFFLHDFNFHELHKKRKVNKANLQLSYDWASKRHGSTSSITSLQSKLVLLIVKMVNNQLLFSIFCLI